MPLGSGKKYKKCHGNSTSDSQNNAASTPPGNYSEIHQHKRERKKLVPPLAQIPNLQPSSWINDRLPEILWAVLLVGQLPRDLALCIFRAVAAHIHSLPEAKRFGDVTQSGLAGLAPDELEHLLGTTVPETARPALTPLRLFDSLPASGIWRKFLSRAREQRGYEALASVVARCLYHQSQEATDCRWLKVLAMGVAGRLVFPSHMPELAEEVLKYPDYGDMRKVRPSIRAMEGAFATSLSGNTEWAALFWNQCMMDTSCFPLESDDRTGIPKAPIPDGALRSVFAALVSHAQETQRTTDVDARHDCVFGTALYCLGILADLHRAGNPTSIIARPALRTLVECHATLAYLLSKDSPDLWMSHRNYGAGQAKLSYLKLKATDRVPTSINPDVLERLANEDRWQEFVPIDLGHWDKADLRKMSEEAGVKQTYDRFYGWTSGFAHGHWGAIRDAAFATCGNPLHRLHRIPRTEARPLPDVMQDACELVDLVLGLVSRAYPPFDERVTSQS